MDNVNPMKLAMLIQDRYIVSDRTPNWKKFVEYAEMTIPTDDKYVRVNFQHMSESMDRRRIEFRFPGGDDYETKEKEIIDWMYRMAYVTLAAFDNKFGQKEYLKELVKFYDKVIIPGLYRGFDLEKLVRYYKAYGELPYDGNDLKRLEGVEAGFRLRLPR